MVRTGKNKCKFFTPVRFLALGFASMILLGAFLLMLPIASRAPGGESFINALFTATSASCVTGLVIADTYQNWTIFGQIVIICLIQVGGLGFITIGSYIALLLKYKLGLKERELVHESVNTIEIGGVFRVVKRIIHGTFMIEFIGAFILAIRFIPRFGWARGIYFAIFHSISAFCNAGFDLMGINEAYSSFVSYEGDWIVVLTLCALILIGGIGFLAWDDIRRNGLCFRKYFLHTKLVLIVTTILTVFGTILFLIVEKDAAFANMTSGERFLGALFSAVTPRTAGFNTVDTAGLSSAGKMLTMLFMFIGGSPGSTAGGCKTTTVLIMFLYMISMIRSRDSVQVLGRRLSQEAIQKANAVVLINTMLILIASMLIFCNQSLPFEDVMFEVFSAMGTAGMSTGITRDLTQVSRIVIICLMYFGRLGSLSFALVFARKKTTAKLNCPEEKIVVG